MRYFTAIENEGPSSVKSEHLDYDILKIMCQNIDILSVYKNNFMAYTGMS